MRDFRDFGVAEIVAAMEDRVITPLDFMVLCYMVGLHNSDRRVPVADAAFILLHGSNQGDVDTIKAAIGNLADAGFMPAHLRAVIADDDGASSGGGE